MSNIPRPMLAAKATQAELETLLASGREWWAFPKIDGIRALGTERGLLSRALKPIPNWWTQTRWCDSACWGLDGELVVGDPWAEDACRKATSGFMTRDGKPDAHWGVFDHRGQGHWPFRERYAVAGEYVRGLDDSRVHLLPYTPVFTMGELLAVEAEALAVGYEGLILRDPQGTYKPGRSTLREGGMVKVKRTTDAEALVIGMVELEHNDNQAEVNELGLTRRSSHQEGKILAGTLGALVVRDLTTGVVFNIGTGFTSEDRARIWEAGESVHGLIAKYRYFGHGVMDKPRHPRWLGWRHKDDMS